MSQFTEAQMITVRTAVEFLAETQRAHHGHVADDVQALLEALNAPVVEAPAKAKKAKVEEVVVEETPAAE